MSYADYADAATTSFTDKGIVVILDLHWNLREKEQTSFALVSWETVSWMAPC